jgi:hypothetical protein
VSRGSGRRGEERRLFESKRGKRAKAAAVEARSRRVRKAIFTF